MKLTIKRDFQDEICTLGNLSINGNIICQTLELPWRENQHVVSCIPFGSYVCKRIVSPHFGDVFEIQNVPGRDNILLHKGNFPKDTHGCVLLGQIRGEHEIFKSKDAFDKFMELTKNEDSMELVIE